MRYRDMPPTACRDCREAEMTWWEKILDRLGRSPVYSGVDSFSIMVSVAMGLPVSSWYDRHVREFERTGLDIELDRALRHIR